MRLQPRNLLDTNICIYLMKHSAACRIGEVLISGITAAELHYGVVASGVEAEHNRAALARFLLEVPVAPFDGAAASVHGPVRLASRERRRDALDKLFAAHALSLGVILATNNPRDLIGLPRADSRKLGALSKGSRQR